MDVLGFIFGMMAFNFSILNIGWRSRVAVLEGRVNELEERLGKGEPDRSNGETQSNA